MIKCNRGEIIISGNIAVILAEYGTLANAIKKSLVERGFKEPDAKKMIVDSAEAGFLTSEELDRTIDELSKKLFKRLF